MFNTDFKKNASKNTPNRSNDSIVLLVSGQREGSLKVQLASKKIPTDSSTIRNYQMEAMKYSPATEFPSDH